MNVQKAWNVFMIRKALLTNTFVGYAFDGGPFGDSMRFQELRDAAASLLYVDLASILDDGIKSRMSPEDYERGRKTKNRLEMLANAARILDLPGLKAINDRRNDIAHEFDKSASVEELDTAIALVGEQLLDWNQIEAVKQCHVKFERSKMRGSEEEGIDMERDLRVIVMDGRDVVAEIKQTQRWHKD